MFTELLRTLFTWIGLGEDDEDTVARRALGWVLLAMISGLVITGFAASRLGASSIGQALLVACGGLATGTLIGFLFALPRTRRERRAAKEDSEPEDERRPTNLEEVADWLTKIIIGVGLTELREVPDFLGKLSTDLRLTTGERQPVEPTMVVLAVTYFWVVGFFLGYLGTRLVLAQALLAADRRARENRLQLRRLATGNLGLSALSPSQQRIVDELRRDPDTPKKVEDLFEDFTRDSAEHDDLRYLRRMGIIKPGSGGTWLKTTPVELSDLTRRLETGPTALEKPREDTEQE